MPVLSQAQQPSEESWHRGWSSEAWGVNSDEALAILGGSDKKPTSVIVAIIANGVDTTDVRLSGPISGWNFLGSADGTVNLTSLGTESFREFQKLHLRFMNTDPIKLKSKRDKIDYERYVQLRAENRIDTYISFSQVLKVPRDGALVLDSLLKKQFGSSDIEIKDIAKVNVDDLDDSYQECINSIVSECSKGLMRGMTKWSEVYDKAIDEYNLSQERVESLAKPRSNPRYTIGDDPEDFRDNNYGNSNLMYEDCKLGSAMAGIITGRSSDENGFGGIFQNAQLMILRAVVDGEPFDKDICNSIRYAVDHGAKVITMCAPKVSSSNSKKLEQALRYAQKADVLVIIAAGDKSRNLNFSPNYPLAEGVDNVLRVGASTNEGTMWTKSNFGNDFVDIFAPGDKVASIYEQGQLAAFSGSAISAASVAGVAAMIRAYYPEISAAQIKKAMMKSARPMNPTTIKTTDGVLEYLGNELSRSSGIVDAVAIINTL